MNLVIFTMYALHQVPEFRAYLQSGSVEDLSVLERYRNSESSRFEILCYNQSQMDTDAERRKLSATYTWMRSVVVTKDAPRRVVCIAPPRSTSRSSFPWQDTSAIVEEPWIEGTMINVFWDDVEHTFVPCTRRCVGARNTFHTHCPDFHTMFVDAMQHCRMTWDMLDRTLSYSFVMQHPKNGMVVPVKQPRLYLVRVYQVLPNGTEVQEVAIDLAIRNALFESDVQFPETRPWNPSTLNRYQLRPAPPLEVGFMLRHKYTGHRFKVMNPGHRHLRHLRGNNGNLQMRYLELRQSRQLHEYLLFFPEHYRTFTRLEERFQAAIDLLSKWYKRVYVERSCTLQQAPAELKRAIRAMQEDIYEREYKRVYRDQVASYLAQMDVQECYELVFSSSSVVQPTASHEPVFCI